MGSPSYASMEEALEVLSAYGPDLKNGLTNHAPMAVEALCALGRPDAALPWIERYRDGLLPRTVARHPIPPSAWREALAQTDRIGDWNAFFERELREAPWREVLNRWVARLAPAMCASAAHGVIRTGHAVRSLAEAESPRRLRELGDGLSYWAAWYQELPTEHLAGTAGLPPHLAIDQVPVVPAAQRVFSGTIVSSLAALQDFPDFARAIALLDVGDDPGALVWELGDVFARVYLANAHNVLTAIVFIHGVTSVAAVGNLLPYLDEMTSRAALSYAWQAACGLYAAFGSQPTPAGQIEPPRESIETLADMAIAHGDEHAIKFAEACLRQNAIRPSPAFLAATRHATGILPRA